MNETKSMATGKRIAATLLGALLISSQLPAQEGQTTFQTYPPNAKVYLRGAGQTGRSYLGNASQPLTLPDLDYSKGYVEFEIEHPDGQHEVKVERVDRTIREGKRWPKQGEIVLPPKSAATRLTDLFNYPTTLSYSIGVIILMLILAGLAGLAILKSRKARLKYENRIRELGGEPNGPRFGPYIPLKVLGRGGFGEVCKAIHFQELYSPDPQFVAIKTILKVLVEEAEIPIDKDQPGTKYPTLPPLSQTEESDFVKRFKREARLLENLNHPNIVRLHSYDFSSDPCYIVMDFIQGESLDKRIANHPQGLPPAEALKIMTTVMAAIAHCHSHKPEIVHRDLKPENIMLRSDGTPVVLDFGIANREGELKITEAGQFIGTTSYMAPESIQGQKGPTLDQYALGAILYEVLVGQGANNAAGNQMRELANAQSGNVKWLKDAKPHWQEFAAAIDKMRAMKPEDRYPSVQAALQTISRLEPPKN